jgi:hypothetical protein
MMAVKSLPIQSYFPVSKPAAYETSSSASSANRVGDGFTSEEVNAVLHPAIGDSRLPNQDYVEHDIASIM